ncbi:hypothetical protein SDC9_160496 [bioreactor metagenome]|uniref:Uncharacterized protein n=1 Tax=bioreactor metagenome TaxID=1076179 RepID=A0A645FHR6_9ZZZZ
MQIGDLAGGMAAQRHRQFFGRNADAVVLHRDQAHAPGQQPHGDLRGSGIQRVVHQFAHGRGGALHHFSGGNLTDQFVRKIADGAAWRSRVGRGGRGSRGGGKGVVHRFILVADAGVCPSPCGRYGRAEFSRTQSGLCRCATVSGFAQYRGLVWKSSAF